MASRIRMTEATMKVLRAFIDAGPRELAGADFINGIRMFSGTLYPILDRLEKAGWIEGRWEKIDPAVEKRPRRKFYRLTAFGQRSAIEELSARGANQLSGWENPISIFVGGIRSV